MNKRAPKWERGVRVERTSEFDLHASAKDIFPLLCPVREYDWIPDWQCTMIYSESGAAEPWAVFHTSHLHGQKEVWTLVTYEPNNLIEYLIVRGTDAVSRLRISLAEQEPKLTHITWSMLFTTTSATGRHLLQNGFAEDEFQAMTRQRQQELDYYLRTGEMVSR